MIDNKFNTMINIGSNKNFGYVFSCIFIMLSILFIKDEYNFYIFSFTTLLILVTFLHPNLLKYPNLIWFKFGLLLGKIISPIFLFLIYLILIIPMGLILKIFRVSLLRNKPSNTKSYWKKKNNLSNVNRQF